MLTIARNCTAEVEAEHQKHREAAFVNGILDASLNGVMAAEASWDDQGNFVDFIIRRINPAFTQLVGPTEEEVLGKPFLTIFPYAKEKGAKINVGPLPIVKGNKRQLEQLFQNLVGNALKYNKPGVAPEVTIAATEVLGFSIDAHLTTEDLHRRYPLITVSDNGIGFEQKDAERIFNVFQRLHGNAEYKGSGVGLSIARKVIENHHGYIKAESQPGEGATFKVYLPINGN